MSQNVGATSFDAFISYRRKGGSEKAQLVKSELLQRGLSDERVFLDTHSLHEGNFEAKIRDAISQSKNVIVIISQGCFDEVRQTDYWYLEISEALRQGKNIIPVLFDDISSISRLRMPEYLAELKEKNCVTYQHEYANAAFDKLYSFLGMGTATHTPKRGCMMKYRGCMFSIMLAFIGLLVLTPIAKSVFENDVTDSTSGITAEVLEPSESPSSSSERVSRLDTDNSDRQLASTGNTEQEEDHGVAASASPKSEEYKLAWATYKGDLNKEGKPHGPGELLITKSHTIGEQDAMPGEVIKGHFENGKIRIAQIHKNNGSVITLRDITLKE